LALSLGDFSPIDRSAAGAARSVLRPRWHGDGSRAGGKPTARCPPGGPPACLPPHCA